jgi:hypothetical protein
MVIAPNSGPRPPAITGGRGLSPGSPTHRRRERNGNAVTVQRSAGKPLSPDSQPIRWWYLIERVLGQWDWTGRLVVLAFAVTTCTTAMLGVVLAAPGAASAGVVVLIVTSWLGRSAKPAAMDVV